MSPEASAALLLGSILKLFLISAAGYAAVRLGLLSEKVTDILSRFIIYISLPCLIIATLGTQLQYDMLGELALCSLAALLLNVLSIAAACIIRKLLIPRDMEGRRLFLSLSSMQNSGYLPIPLIAAILPETLKARGLLLTFIYMLVMGFIFWSLGIWLISGGPASGWRNNLKKTANPPIIALLTGLIFLVPSIKEAFVSLDFVPEILTMTGNTTIPLVMIVLGASFGKRTRGRAYGGRIISIAAFVKLAVIPAAVLLIVKIFGLEGPFAFVLVIQAVMPAAMNHIVVAREFGGDILLTSRALFVQYLLSILTVPLFLYMFELL